MFIFRTISQPWALSSHRLAAGGGLFTNYACGFSQSETERYFEWIIIHHNQLLLTKFGKNFVILSRWRQNDVKSAAWLQVIEPLTGKTWRRGWVVLVVKTKWRNCRGTFYSFHGDIFSKNFSRTARRQLDDNICYLEHICRPEQTLIS